VSTLQNFLSKTELNFDGGRYVSMKKVIFHHILKDIHDSKVSKRYLYQLKISLENFKPL